MASTQAMNVVHNEHNGITTVNSMNYFYEINVYNSLTAKELLIDVISSLHVRYCLVAQRRTSSRVITTVFVEYWSPITVGGCYRFLYTIRPDCRGHIFVKNVCNREHTVTSLINFHRDSYCEAQKNLLDKIVFRVHGCNVELDCSVFKNEYDSCFKSFDDIVETEDDHVSVDSLKINV